jgi:protein Mpv17
MDKIIPGNCVKSVTQKILIDQFINSPLFITQFYYTAGLLEHRSLSDITHELKQKFLRIYIADWTIWPAAQALNFYFLPGPYRVLFINFVTMFYNVFLCWMKKQKYEVPGHLNAPEKN